MILCSGDQIVAIAVEAYLEARTSGISGVLGMWSLHCQRCRGP
jgi:hypothetical protein